MSTTHILSIGDTDLIVLDQFVGPSEYRLAKHQPTWESFAADVQAGGYDSTIMPIAVPAASFDPRTLRFGTTAYGRTEDGRVRIVAAKWDSSG